MSTSKLDLIEHTADPAIHRWYEKLRSILDSYLDPKQIDSIYRAFEFGAKAHHGQKRLTGEPYIIHPLAVACILADMHMDHQSITAAILHDVIEDTSTAKEQIAHYFDQEVAELVDGVSKLTQFEASTPAEAQAANLRKMILAMTKDIRVILVKLADRLHNMRTIGVMSRKKQRQISKETLEIYAPIANRLGMNMIRIELQDLGFQHLYPMRYRIIEETVRKTRGNRKEIVQKTETALRERFSQEGLSAQVIGREKHPYSIYQKMLKKHLSFTEVFDVYGFRIVVDTVDTCYRALGVVHNLYKPVPGRFKDYIAIPKANGYQSLHTILFGPSGVPIEVQIRSQDMEKVAERGIAAHWLYKSGDSSNTTKAHNRARDWLKQLLEMQQHAGDSLEFIENVKIDLFPDAVYVFSPMGEIFELPQGATPVDFAYAVHTDIGDRCVAAKINHRLTPLRTRLSSGQTVEVITAPGSRPNPSWLNFVVSAKARSSIRHFLKNLKKEESVSLGKRLLEQALGNLGTTLQELPEEHLQSLITQLKLDDVTHLLSEIGFGNRMAPLVAKRLMMDERVLSQDNPQEPLYIRGTEGMVVTFARCCHPIPGDPIIGYISAGKGIVLHRQNCKNVMTNPEESANWIEIDWEHDIDRDFPVDIRVQGVNQRGVLATVAAAISDTGANIENVSIKEKDGRYSTIHFTLDVKSRQHLARIMRQVRSIDNVIKITRVRS